VTNGIDESTWFEAKDEPPMNEFQREMFSGHAWLKKARVSDPTCAS
jgi:hypothetical protein